MMTLHRNRLRASCPSRWPPLHPLSTVLARTAGACTRSLIYDGIPPLATSRAG
jgi:hypothetical protein